MNGSDTLIYCVEILLDFSLIFCVRYIYFGFLLKANVLLANPSLVISGKCILTERNKYIASLCSEVIFVKISAILSSTMLLLFKDFLFYWHIYIYIRIYIYIYTWFNSGRKLGKFSSPKENVEILKNARLFYYRKPNFSCFCRVKCYLKKRI